MENNHTDNKGILRSEAGRFLPGSGGRPHGATNRAKKVLRKFVEQKLDDLEKEYSQLEPKERLRFLQGVLGYIVPKLQSAVDSNGEDTAHPLSIDFSSLSESTLREILLHTHTPTDNEE